MNEEDIKVVQAMEQYGGSFVKALAQACWHADQNNLKIIKNSFQVYWEEYTKMINK